MLLAVAALLAVPAISACGVQASPTTSRSSSLGKSSELPRSPTSHVVVVMMENAEYENVIGNSAAPYINSLARRYGLMTHSFAIRHPSLPNYIALTSGSTQGIASDCTDCEISAPNIVDQLERAGVSWGAYLQSMPSPCFLGAQAGLYAKKHNPFAYYTDIARSPTRCAHMVGFRRLASDLRSGRLPTYAWVSPNLCNDGHDCPLATADRFLAGSLPPLLHGLGPHGFLVLTWDEGEGKGSNGGCCGVAKGGHIVTVVAGPDVRRGAQVSTPIDQYGVLGSIEQTLGLPALGGAADPRSGRLSGAFVRIPRFR